MKFSLIVATYGRDKEVEMLLNSIRNTDYNKEKLEVIIVDQNDNNNIANIVTGFPDIKINHIKSNIKGLSRNRNIGIKEATGEIIAFPDDDCEYLKDTLESVQKAFDEHRCDVVMGRIVKRDGSDSLRSWSKNKHGITKNNFYTKCSSITMYLKNDKDFIYFNERLGVGNYFGSCEDTDILYRSLKANNKVVYDPSIVIYHPHYDSNHNMADSKVISYGLGFGAFVRSNLDINTFFLYIKALSFHILKVIINILRLNFTQARKSSLATWSRIKGFLIFK